MLGLYLAAALGLALATWAAMGIPAFGTFDRAKGQTPSASSPAATEYRAGQHIGTAASRKPEGLLGIGERDVALSDR